MLCWKRNSWRVFGPRKENNGLKGPCWIIELQRKQNRTLSPTLMLRAWCIYLGLITPCPETSHLLHLPGTYHPLPRNLPTPTSAWDLSPPAQKPPTSYICLGLIIPCPETSHLLQLPGTYHPLPRGLITPCPKPPPLVQLQMSSQPKITQNFPPN